MKYIKKKCNSKMNLLKFVLNKKFLSTEINIV